MTRTLPGEPARLPDAAGTERLAEVEGDVRPRRR
ncbi:hypothetical protein ACVW07_001593 [Cellulomonas sp. URHB0016]